MNNMNSVRTAGLTVLAASLAVAFGSAAADDEVLRLMKPESSVWLGAGYLTDDAARFGQYSGLKDDGLYAIGNIFAVRRDDATGTWLVLDGRNLGLESRELRFEHQRQGNWRYFLGYDKTPRFSPYIVNTGLQGIGSNNLVVGETDVGLRDVRLKTVREAVTLGGQKILADGFDVKVSFKNETKDGARLFGRGTTGTFQQFLAEPIDHTMQQVDVVLGYTAERLQLSGGYYGSFFKNDNRALNIAGGSTPQLEPFTPIGLPPDNHAHQFHLAGGYSLTPTTRTNFKVARTVARQTDSFILPSAPGRSNLGGRVETTSAQLGFSARPMQKLSVLANLRYEDRDDKTPQRQYFDETPTFSGVNETRSLRTIAGKLEGSYLLPAAFRLTGGVDYDERKRNAFPDRLVSFRKTTRESAYRIELRRSLSETLNGSLGFVYSERDGSRFLPAASLADDRQVAPVHLADRDREKVRLRLDWAPLDPLTVQFLADLSRDDYGGGDFGLDKGRAHFLSLDASYAFSPDWQGHAWVSRERSRVVNLARSGANDWRANLRLATQAFGVGARGNVGYDWKVGADLQYSRDRSEYALMSATTDLTSLPEVRYSVATLKLFAEYAMKKDLALRLDAVHDRWKTNDWLWDGSANGPYRYVDGTTLRQDPRQSTTFVGVSVRYNWR